jgi:hypothetical protein
VDGEVLLCNSRPWGTTSSNGLKLVFSLREDVEDFLAHCA